MIPGKILLNLHDFIKGFLVHIPASCGSERGEMWMGRPRDAHQDPTCLLHCWGGGLRRREADRAPRPVGKTEGPGPVCVARGCPTVIIQEGIREEDPLPANCCPQGGWRPLALSADEVLKESWRRAETDPEHSRGGDAGDGGSWWGEGPGTLGAGQECQERSPPTRPDLEATWAALSQTTAALTRGGF